MDDRIKLEVKERIKITLSTDPNTTSINCPECESIEDDQYGCTTCWAQGGNGKIEITDFEKEQLTARTRIANHILQKESEGHEVALSQLCYMCDAGEKTPTILNYNGKCQECNGDKFVTTFGL